MVAMPPCPSSSTSRYRPPRTVPMSVKRPPWVAFRPASRPGPPSSRGGIVPYDASPIAGRDAVRRSSCCPVSLGPAPPLEVQGAEVGSKIGAQVRPLEGDVDGGLEPAHGGPGVVADT